MASPYRRSTPLLLAVCCMLCVGAAAGAALPAWTSTASGVLQCDLDPALTIPGAAHFWVQDRGVIAKPHYWIGVVPTTECARACRGS